MVRNEIAFYNFSIILRNLPILHSSTDVLPSPPTFQTDPLHTSLGTTGMPWALVHDDVR